MEDMVRVRRSLFRALTIVTACMPLLSNHSSKEKVMKIKALTSMTISYGE